MKNTRFFRSPLAIILMVLMVSASFAILIPVFAPQEVEIEDPTLEDESRQDVTATGFVPVNVFMKESYTMSPREPMVNDYDLEQSCPNGYVGDGLFGLGIVSFFGHVHWKTVGTWKTNELRSELVISGKVRYSLWLYTRGNSVTGDFRITLLNNDKEIGGTMKEIFNYRVAESPNELMIEFDAGGNITPLQPADILAMKIECRIQGGAYLYYGGPTYKSGVQLTCNSLQVPEIKYDSSERTVIAQVSDAFGISPALMNPTLLIDDAPGDIEYNLGLNADTYNWELTYFLYLNEELRAGEHIATIVFAYSKASPMNVTNSVGFRYDPPKDRIDLDKYLNPAFVCPIVFFISIFVGLIIGVRKVRKHRRKKGLEGLMGKPGGFWYKKREKRMAKKALKQRKKDDKQRQKDLKKMGKGRR